MTPKLVKFPDSLLRRKCDIVTEFDSELNRVADAMLSMLKPLQAVGLAAQQLGFIKRIAVFLSPTIPALMSVMVNPKIIWSSPETDTAPEGCVSLPGIQVQVTRPRIVVVQWQDLQGAVQSARVEGYVARVIQHECDHLDGILLTDKGSPFMGSKS